MASARASSLGPGGEAESRTPRLARVIPNFMCVSQRSWQVSGQPFGQHPSGDASGRCRGQQQQPADRRAADDQAHANPQKHAADEGADDAGGEAQIQDVAVRSIMRVSQPRAPGFDNSRPRAPRGGKNLTIPPTTSPIGPRLPMPGTWTDPIFVVRARCSVLALWELLRGPAGLPVQKPNLRKGNAPMTKRAESKYKINRRLGVNLWGRAKSPIGKRDYGPGQHGQRRKKPTDFGTQLMAKQKLKGYYGNIGEKQFRKYYEEAVRRKGDTTEKLVEILERRLDAVCYRLKFALTPFAARQFVSHGHVQVNGKRVNIPSYLLRDNDTDRGEGRSRSSSPWCSTPRKAPNAMCQSIWKSIIAR